jgi:hypothetical protein
MRVIMISGPQCARLRLNSGDAAPDRKGVCGARLEAISQTTLSLGQRVTDGSPHFKGLTVEFGTWSDTATSADNTAYSNACTYWGAGC